MAEGTTGIAVDDVETDGGGMLTSMTTVAEDDISHQLENANIQFFDSQS